MIKLTKSVAHWNKPEFKNILKGELQDIDPTLLPLQQGLSLSSYVGSSSFNAVILNISDNADSIAVKAGIFYSGIIAGCSCSDDPSPVDEQTEYCELNFDINKLTAITNVSLINN